MLVKESENSLGELDSFDGLLGMVQKRGQAPRRSAFSPRLRAVGSGPVGPVPVLNHAVLLIVLREDYLRDTLKVTVSREPVQPKYRSCRLSGGSSHLEVAAYELRQAASVLEAIPTGRA